MSAHIQRPTSTANDTMLRNDFLNEMGVGVSSPDTLTDEEKKRLEEEKVDRQSSDLDTSMNAFAMQLTQVKSDLQNNRLVVANLFKEVESFHEAQSKLIDEE